MKLENPLWWSKFSSYIFNRFY